MKISTRGRYAMRVMIDLAEHNDGSYIPLKGIAERQDISLKYLESIMADLSKAGMIDGLHGKGGGYRLKRAPEEYPAGEVLRITEGDLAPVACLEKNASPCSHAAECKTLSMWKDFYSLINGFFDGITIANLMESPDPENNYII